MKRFDAAIIGAGPAGSSAAIFLARKGYSVALLDKQLFPRGKLCGDFLNPANWEIFERLDLEDALFSVEHEKVRSFRISTSSSTTAIAFPSQNGRRFFGLGLRRSLFDDMLLRLAKKEGVTVKQGCKLIGLSRERNGWSLSWGDGSAEERLHSTLLIGADGRNSWVANRLGLAAPGEGSGRFVAFQLHLRDCRGVGGEVQIHFFPGGYAGLVGLGGGAVNLCFTVEKKRARENAVEVLFEKYLYRNPHLKEALEASERIGKMRSAYPVYFSPRRCYGDGFLLVGDAARVTEPVTGEGVYFALKSGELAAEAAHSAFNEGDLSSRRLSGYDIACRSSLARRQRINGLIRALVHRPRLLAPLLALSSQTKFPISPLVRRVCMS